MIINTTDDISILGADYGVYYDGTYVIGFEDQADYDNAICYCVNNGYQFAIDGDMTVCGNGSFITNASINPSATTRVAVIDTGSNLANESYSVIGDDTNDYNGHGTAMSNIILENTSDAYIISIKALGDDGHGEMSNVYAAVQYAMDMDVDVILLAMSMRNNGNCDAFSALISEAQANGITVIASAGNNNTDAYAYIPAGLSGVITVGALNSDLTKNYLSNYGGAVNYYVVESSTSNAAAKFTGMYITNNYDEVYTEFLNEVPETSDGEWEAAEDYFAVNGTGEMTWLSADTLNALGYSSSDEFRDAVISASSAMLGGYYASDTNGWGNNRVDCITFVNRSYAQALGVISGLNVSGHSISYNGLTGFNSTYGLWTQTGMDIQVRRKYSLHFQKGEVIGDVDKALVKEAYRFNRTGTIQHWKPDSDVFTDTDIPIERLRDILEKQSVVNGGIEFVLIDDVLKTEESYLCPEGILGFCKKLSSEKGLTLPFLIQGSGKGRDADDRSIYNVKSQIAFAFNNDVNVLQYFHNSSYLEHGGSPENAVKNAFVYIIDKEIKARDKYKAKENKVKFDDIKESLILITNTFSTQTSYANQTKKAINNKFIQDFMTDLIKSNLEIWFIENRALGDKVIDQILLNKRSRENAEKNRSKFIDELNNKKTNDISNKIKKFRDCKSKDTSIRELYIVEGDSAMGSIIQARDSEFQAVMPIRGKILNCLKASYSKILESDIIIDLIKVLGCGVELQNKHSKDLSAFHLERLQWNKIIICTDADVDGFQIRTLLAAMIYRLAPTLIEKGFVYT